MTTKNIYVKLQEARVKLQNSNLKKSGKNAYAGFEYFELSDIMPTLNTILDELKLTFLIDFKADIASLMLINSEEPTEILEVNCPYAEANLKGCQPIQNLGGQQTYIRRYLIINTFNITEPDLLDGSVGQLITDKQKKMLFAISKGKTNEVKEILGKYGYTSSGEIKMKDFNNICDEIKALG